MLSKANPKNLFTPNFRPSQKLVWDGNKFSPVPAKEIAVMLHPKTKQKMVVIEPTATNHMTFSSDFVSNGNGWSLSPDLVVQEVPSAIGGGRALSIEHTTTGQSIWKSAGAFSEIQTVYIIISSMEQEPLGHTRLNVYNNTTNLPLTHIRYNWEEKAAQVTSGATFVLDYGAINFSDYVLMWVTVDGSSVLGNTRRILIYPDVRADTLETVAIHHVQVEDTPYWTSPIVTGASAVSRAADSFRVDNFEYGGQEGTMYVESIYPTGSVKVTNSRLIQEGQSSGEALIMYPSSLGTIRNRAYIALNSQSLITGGLTSPDTQDLLKYAASFSKSEIIAALEGRTSSRENTFNAMPVAPRFHLGAPVSEPIWVTKVWRDTKVRSAEQLSELTS